MDLGLAGMKALVTGGTKGIGRAVAEHLAAEGCDVAICARNAEEVAQTVAALSQRGVKATGRAVDVADGPALTQWICDVGAELGGIDIVVSNVSALAIGQVETSWQAEFNTDMMGTVRSVNAAMPFLEKSRAASIVVIASVSGREVDFAAGPYGVFKAALIHYAKGLSFQLAPKNRADPANPGNCGPDRGHQGDRFHRRLSGSAHGSGQRRSNETTNFRLVPHRDAFAAHKVGGSKFVDR
jgi:3-oxoacyl-[acyl-carrier protein] reductase